MTDNDIEKILHRAAELQGLRTLEPAPQLPDSSDRQKLKFVAEAAEEVGISRVDFALAEAELTGSPSQKPVNARSAARARRWLKDTQRVFELETIVPAPPAEVLAALQSVLASSDFQVQIANVVGQDPLVDGILVVEPADLFQLSVGQVTKFRYLMATADFRQVLLTVRPDPESQGQTQLRMHTALDHSAVVNHQWSLALTGILAPLAAAGVAFLAAPAGLAASLGLGTAALVATALGLKAAWGVWYHWGLEQGRKGLRDLAAGVDRAVRLKGL